MLTARCDQWARVGMDQWIRPGDIDNRSNARIKFCRRATSRRLSRAVRCTRLSCARRVAAVAAAKAGVRNGLLIVLVLLAAVVRTMPAWGLRLGAPSLCWPCDAGTMLRGQRRTH